jgi:hypothetical protein
VTLVAYKSYVVIVNNIVFVILGSRRLAVCLRGGVGLHVDDWDETSVARWMGSQLGSAERGGIMLYVKFRRFRV